MPECFFDYIADASKYCFLLIFKIKKPDFKVIAVKQFILIRPAPQFSPLRRIN